MYNWTRVSKTKGDFQWDFWRKKADTNLHSPFFLFSLHFFSPFLSALLPQMHNREDHGSSPGCRGVKMWNLELRVWKERYWVEPEDEGNEGRQSQEMQSGHIWPMSQNTPGLFTHVCRCRLDFSVTIQHRESLPLKLEPYVVVQSSDFKHHFIE